jgi:carbonic anhydrase/acetyltransferase-like protein (isoleucine patch superfamily)
VLNRARVETRAVVGAGAVVTEGAVVPSGHTALGVPARPRPGGIDEEWHAEAVGMYVANGRRYAAELKRIHD